MTFMPGLGFVQKPVGKAAGTYGKRTLGQGIRKTRDLLDPDLLVWLDGDVFPRRLRDAALFLTVGASPDYLVPTTPVAPPVAPPPAVTLTRTVEGCMFSFPAYTGPGTLKGYVTKSSYTEIRQQVDVTPLLQVTTGTDTTCYDNRTIWYWHYAVLGDNTEVLLGKQNTVQLARNWSEETETLVIRSGGTYTLNIRNTTGKLTVSVNTSEQVKLTGRIASTGNAVQGFGNNVVADGLRIWLLYPGGNGRLNGFGISFEDFKTATIQHCYVEDAATSFQVKTYKGDGKTYGGRTVFNRSRNVCGMYTDGNGGYKIPPTTGAADDDKTFYRCQTIMFILNQGVPGYEIAWNVGNNEPEFSRVEDNGNTLGSTAADGTLILVHDNLIDGAYPYRPAVPVRTGANANYTGGGILPADANGSRTHVYNNVIVRASHYGVGILNGNNIWNNGNRVVSSGFLYDGRINYAHNDRSAGIFFYSSDPNTPFFANEMRDNYIAFQSVLDDGTFAKRFAFAPANDGSNFTGNVAEPKIVTLQDELAEVCMYRARMAAAGYTAGP